MLRSRQVKTRRHGALGSEPVTSHRDKHTYGSARTGPWGSHSQRQKWGGRRASGKGAELGFPGDRVSVWDGDNVQEMGGGCTAV